MQSGKGFGKPAPKKKAAVPPKSAAPAAAVARRSDDGDDGNELSRGRAALEAMRRSSGGGPALPKGNKLQLTPEEEAEIRPDEGIMPEVVSQRMLRRVVPFAGIPIALAFLVFIGFYVANTQFELDLPPSIVAGATQVLFVTSFGGITWGVMSTSWEEDEEGTLLGWEQVQKNTAMMRGDLAAGRGKAAAMYELEDAAEDGVFLSEEAKEKFEKKRAGK